MKNNKYNYYNVIQQNFGAYGWEDVSHYEADSQGNATEMSGTFRTLKNGRKVERKLITCDLEQYRLTGYPTRVIFRKELK